MNFDFILNIIKIVGIFQILIKSALSEIIGWKSNKFKLAPNDADVCMPIQEYDRTLLHKRWN